MPPSVGVPTASSMGSSFGDYGAGLAGGAVYGVASGLLGNGLLGSPAAPILAASVIKGARGQIISTLAGFRAGADLLAAIGSRSGPATSGRGEM